MRWPLRNQIMLPMLGLMLAALVGVSILNAYLAGRNSKQQIEHQLHEVTSTLAQSNFPLTSAVLKQMAGLSGAEFIAESDSGEVFQSRTWQGDLPKERPIQQPASFNLGEQVQLDGKDFFHTVVLLQRSRGRHVELRLHILYPVSVYQKAWQQAFYPPLVIGAIALLLVISIATVVSARLVRPMLELQSQVGKIASGNFQSMELPKRDDEIRDLSRSINRMAELLGRYEVEVRQNERLRTLGQLGSGIAHQIRNSATGCRLAIELHQRDCQPEDSCDCLDIANRQVTLMEKQLKRFLSLGVTKSSIKESFDLTSLVENTIPLLEPYARHVNVELGCTNIDSSFTIVGDQNALEQLLINLLVNAIEAAAQCDSTAQIHSGKVTIALQPAHNNPDCVQLVICDTGRGPTREMQSQLFEPFATSKHDGTGLGLSVAQEIAEQHGGNIYWNRQNSMTCFTVELPFEAQEIPSVEVTCR